MKEERGEMSCCFKVERGWGKGRPGVCLSMDESVVKG